MTPTEQTSLWIPCDPETIKAMETPTEEPSASLRWNKGVLEQGWAISRWRGGCRVAAGFEWRPVPDAALSEEGE